MRKCFSVFLSLQLLLASSAPFVFSKACVNVRVGAKTGAKTAKAAGQGAYEVAKAAGKHAGKLKNYVTRSDLELNKAIKSLQSGKKGIDVHLDKLANPRKYVPDWDTLRPEHRAALIRDWGKEINNAREQIQVLQGILQNR